MFDHFSAISNVVLTHISLDTLATFSGQQIAQKIREFISPLVLIGIAAVSIYYLLIVKQMVKFLQFAGLAILAGIFFYVPGVVESASTTVSGWFS